MVGTFRNKLAISANVKLHWDRIRFLAECLVDTVSVHTSDVIGREDNLPESAYHQHDRNISTGLDARHCARTSPW